MQEKQIQIFGAQATPSGRLEPDVWARLPKAVLKKHCWPDEARLDIRNSENLFLMKVPKSTILFVVQFMTAGEKDAKPAESREKYPFGDLAGIIALHEAALDLGMKAILERTSVDIGNANSFLSKAPKGNNQSGAARKTSPPIKAPAPIKLASTTAVLTKPIPALRFVEIQIPTVLVAVDDDGWWIVHNTSKDTGLSDLRRFYRKNNPYEKFSGTLRAIGTLRSVTQANPTAATNGMSSSEKTAPVTNDTSRADVLTDKLVKDHNTNGTVIVDPRAQSSVISFPVPNPSKANAGLPLVNGDREAGGISAGPGTPEDNCDDADLAGDNSFTLVVRWQRQQYLVVVSPEACSSVIPNDELRAEGGISGYMKGVGVLVG